MMLCGRKEGSKEARKNGWMKKGNESKEDTIYIYMKIISSLAKKLNY